MLTEIARAVDHQENRLLAALDPDDFAQLAPALELVELPRGKVLYEAGETIHHSYFPQDSITSLVTVMQNGETVETAVFGREGVLGFSSALVTRHSFGRYIVQIPGTASRIPLVRLRESFEASSLPFVPSCCAIQKPCWRRPFRVLPAMRSIPSSPAAAAGF